MLIELQVQYTKMPSSNLGRISCVQKLFLTFRTIFVHNMFSPWSEKRRASDKSLLVPSYLFQENYWLLSIFINIFIWLKQYLLESWNSFHLMIISFELWNSLFLYLSWLIVIKGQRETRIINKIRQVKEETFLSKQRETELKTNQWNN